MSKKKGNKKNLDFGDDFEENKTVDQTSDITSKGKGKAKKKSKINIDTSDIDDGDIPKKSNISDDEPEVKPVKKSQKKGQ